MKLNGAIQTEEKKFFCVPINTAILLACIYKEARKAHRLYAYKILMRINCISTVMS